MKCTYTSKRELSFASLLLLATHLICPPVNAMDRHSTDQVLDGQHNAPAHPQQVVLQDFFTKLEPKLVYGVLENSLRSKGSSRLFDYRLVCKTWANIVNSYRKLAYHISLNPYPSSYQDGITDPKKHLPPYSKNVPAALGISNYEDAKIGTLYNAISKLKGYPVEIIQWFGSLNFNKPIPDKRREFEPYTISADNINYIFEMISDTFNPDILKTLDFRLLSLNASSKELAELLVKFPKLEHLVIHNANIIPEDMEMIINALPKSLVSLDLTDNQCGSKGFEALIKKLPDLENLKLLGIQTGSDTKAYCNEHHNFYGSHLPPINSNLTNNLIKTYQGGKEHHRKIV
jgi:hypothetical protein